MLTVTHKGIVTLKSIAYIVLKEHTLWKQLDLVKMKKLIEEMHICVTEKDAEIFKLKIHLGDEIRLRNAR